MKRKIIGVIALTLCALIAVFCLTACGSSEGGSGSEETTATTEAPKPSIVGTWEETDSTSDGVFVFNEDGTGTYSMGENSLTFTYEDKGTTIIMTIDTIGTQNVKYVIDGDKLTMTDEADKTITLTRK